MDRGHPRVKYNTGNGSLQTIHNPTEDKEESNRQEREPGLQIQLNPRNDYKGTEGEQRSNDNDGYQY